MSDGREFIEWLIDVLPTGYEWLGRPIVGIGTAFLVCVGGWIIWCVVKHGKTTRP